MCRAQSASQFVLHYLVSGCSYFTLHNHFYPHFRMNRRLEGGCQVPISGFARLNGNELNMQARVGSISGAGPLIIKEKTIEIDMSKPWAEVPVHAVYAFR